MALEHIGMDGLVSIGSQLGKQAVWHGLTVAYKWFTEREAYTGDYLKSYYNLLVAHRRLGVKTPAFWKLDEENRPQFELKYDILIRNLKSKAELLKLRRSEVHLARAAMLLVIADYLLVAMHHTRTWDKMTGQFIRPDGVEAMFFAEFIDWFERVVPNLNENHPETNELFAKRALYCREVFDLVVLNIKGSESSINPKSTVQRLTQQMEMYHAHLVQHHKALMFNTLIHRLSDDLLGLSVKGFNALFLLIQGVNQPYLLPEQFLRPMDSDVKIIHMKQTHLGKWLSLTLEKAGITASTFASENILALDELKVHLEGEHPNDYTPSLSEHLLDPLHPEWGHWGFITDKRCPKNQDATAYREAQTQKANKYLLQIRSLYLKLLQMHFIRQNLLRAALVANVFGEIWMYGDPVGQAVLEELLTGVLEVTEGYYQLFDEFWHGYYEQHYREQSRRLGEDDASFPCHFWLNHIDRHIKPEIRHNIDAIKGTLGAIRKQANELPKTLEKIQRIKKDLFNDMLSFLTYLGKTESSNYQIIQRALHGLTTSSLTGSQLLAEYHLTAKIEKQALKDYQRNLRIIQATDQIERAYISNRQEVKAEIQKLTKTEQVLREDIAREQDALNQQLIEKLGKQYAMEQKNVDDIHELQAELETIQERINRAKTHGAMRVDTLSRHLAHIKLMLTTDLLEKDASRAEGQNVLSKGSGNGINEASFDEPNMPTSSIVSPTHDGGLNAQQQADKNEQDLQELRKLAEALRGKAGTLFNSSSPSAVPPVNEVEPGAAERTSFAGRG